MNLAIFYFSATGITELISNHIATILEREGHFVNLRNIITPESRQSRINFAEFDACFFGFPVYGGRPPYVADNWMKSIKGKNLKCSMFFTYGSRDLELAHQVTYYLLTEANFQVVLSAEFIGKHSFSVAEGWSLASDRPNKQDFDTATKFALESIKRFQSDSEFSIDLSDFTYEPIINTERKGSFAEFYPSRGKNECSMCYLCENECPVKAFGAESGETNRKLCIMCMHCVTICPDNIIQLGDVLPFCENFIKITGLSQDVVDQKRSKILY
ncbi:MAG: EFR1 family ferrodoxin [Candidatus Thorarchaeota archaeon]